MSLDQLVTEQQRPQSADLDLQSTPELLATINAADAEIAAAVAREIPMIAAAVDAIAERMRTGGRLFYIGAGTSGRLGVLDASECPPTFGVSWELVQGIIAGGTAALTRSIEGAEDDLVAGANELIDSRFAKKDTLVGIAASGRTPYVLGALKKARAIGGLTCSIGCVPNAEISKSADFPIEVVVGPEVLTGSTRMRAGTATKMILNMISTAVMVRLGHVYGNLMVNVQPTNKKLIARAQRIVQTVTGCSGARSVELFEASGRSVRIAILMEKKSLSKIAAEELLRKADGSIRAALA
jgi:N-acetylmuramic acid 6-phosphate etherase